MSDVVEDVVRFAQRDFEFKGEIGKGGFSTVYKVVFKVERDIGGHRLRPGYPAAAKKLNKVDNVELDILSKLKHPNVVSLFGVIDEKPRFYLILELCDAGSLREYLDLNLEEPLPALLVACWCEQGARAIEYLHENSVIHRDIKSPNFLITSSRNLKLTDFGISKTSDITITTAIKGTWGWTPPEVFIEQHISPLSDIYSYATVIWEIITRKVPLEGCGYHNVMYRVGRMKERHEIPAECPGVIANLLLQCWEEDRKMRPSISGMVCVLSAHRADVQVSMTKDKPEFWRICPFLQIIIDFEGKHSPLTVNHGTTLLEIKMLVQQIAGATHPQLKLFYHCEELSDGGLTLLDYRVNEGEKLHLRRVITVRIKSETGKVAIVQAFGDESIRTLKTKIPFVEEGISVEMGHLVHLNQNKEQDLDDNMSLADYKVNNGTTLHLIYEQVIFVKCKEGHTIQLTSRSNQTIGQIQEILFKLENVSSGEQHLILQDSLYSTLSKFTKLRSERRHLQPNQLLHSLKSQQLRKATTLYQCNVRNGDTLHMMDLDKALTIHETLIWLPEDEKTMVVIPSLTLADLRSVLNRVGCDLPPLQSMCDRPLSYFGLQDGTTLSLRYCHV